MNTKYIYFSFLSVGFCPKNLAFARKMMVLPESGGLQPIGLYAYDLNPNPRFYQVKFENYGINVMSDNNRAIE